MVSFEWRVDGVPVTLWSAELEALSLVPPAWLPPERAANLRARLAERATPHLEAAVALATSLKAGGKPSRLLQCADWHGDRCVFSVEPRGLFLKPKKRGAEEFIYALLARLAGERLGRGASVQLLRQDGFLIQETIGEAAGAVEPRAAGLILGAIFMLGLTDLNAENLRVQDGIPMPVDVECAFDFEFYGHASRKVIMRRLREQAQAIEIAARGAASASERPWLGAVYRDAFAEAASYVREAMRYAFSEEAHFDELYFRRVFLPTRVYLNFIRRRTLFEWDDEKAVQSWKAARGESASREMIAAETRALLTGNVPFFHRQGARLLDGADGAMLGTVGQSVAGEMAAWIDRWPDDVLLRLAQALGS